MRCLYTVVFVGLQASGRAADREGQLVAGFSETVLTGRGQVLARRPPPVRRRLHHSTRQPVPDDRHGSTQLRGRLTREELRLRPYSETS